MELQKCMLCGSKKSEKVFYETKLAIGNDGYLCKEPCLKQREECEIKNIEEIKEKCTDITLYSRKPTIVMTPPPEKKEPDIVINNIYNITNNTNNNDNRVTNYNEYNEYYEGEVLDKLSLKREKAYQKLMEEEKIRIQRQKEWRMKKIYYNVCSRCKKKKHYDDYDIVLDKLGEPELLTKMGGIENPKNEEGEPMYKRKETCSECLTEKKKYNEENKAYLKEVKKINSKICDCGGKFFTGYGDNNMAEYDWARHMKTKKHQEYQAKKNIKDGGIIQFDKFNRNMLREICKLNGITGYNNMTKQQSIDAIYIKQKELQAENSDIVFN